MIALADRWRVLREGGAPKAKISLPTSLGDLNKRLSMYGLRVICGDMPDKNPFHQWLKALSLGILLTLKILKIVLSLVLAKMLLLMPRKKLMQQLVWN